MKTASLLILLLLFSAAISSAQVSISGGIYKSEIKPRTSPPPPPLPQPVDADTNKVRVKIWPSPAPGDFNLLVKTPASDRIEVKVFDLSGRDIMRFEARNDQNLAFGSTLQPGLYLVHIRQAVFEGVFKVVKQ